jgi:8-amino-7-oxononanoate synthase
LEELIGHLYFQLKTLVPHVKRLPCGTRLLQVPHLIPQSPIFALLTPEPRSLAKWCQDGGFVVRPIVPPTVPEGTQRVRICLHAGNSFEDLRRLVERIREWLERRGGLEDVDDGREERRVEFKAAL